MQRKVSNMSDKLQERARSVCTIGMVNGDIVAVLQEALQASELKNKQVHRLSDEEVNAVFREVRSLAEEGRIALPEITCSAAHFFANTIQDKCGIPKEGERLSNGLREARANATKKMMEKQTGH